MILFFFLKKESTTNRVQQPNVSFSKRQSRGSVYLGTLFRILQPLVTVIKALDKKLKYNVVDVHLHLLNLFSLLLNKIIKCHGVSRDCAPFYLFISCLVV